MAEKIKLSDLLGSCLEFKQNPSEKNKLQIEELVSSFQIASYTSIKNKMLLAVTIFNNCAANETDALTTEANFTIAKTIYGILGYVVNLENDLDFAAFDVGVVDMLYEFGIIDEVLIHCKVDYERFEKMLNNILHYSNIFRLTELSKWMGEENIDNLVKEIGDIPSQMTPERLQELKDSMLTSHSPELAKLKALVIGSLSGNFEQTLNLIKEKVEEKTSTEKKEEDGANG